MKDGELLNSMVEFFITKRWEISRNLRSKLKCFFEKLRYFRKSCRQEGVKRDPGKCKNPKIVILSLDSHVFVKKTSKLRYLDEFVRQTNPFLPIGHL
jgi:hypothetical protein